MHKQLVNELRLWFAIRPVGPLLIKSGKGAGVDPTRLDMNFVRVTHSEIGETVYLPGSSLKGVLRSYSEKIARTVGVKCCDPLGAQSCGKISEGRPGLNSAQVYANLCTICRVFGHMPMASHLRVSDAYPRDPFDPDRKVNWKELTNATEERDGVAIDRISGSVAVGPFQLEVVTRGGFFGQLYLRNFQIWQIGLLAIALRDIDNGMVPIGFAKSRGLGQVRVVYQRMEISYPGQMGAAATRWGNVLAGVTAFNVAGAANYNFEPEATLTLKTPGQVETGWGRVTTQYNDEAGIKAALEASVERWAQFVAHRQENPQ